MAACLIVLAAYLVYPVLLLLVLSFNQGVNVLVPPFEWGLGNWQAAFAMPGLFSSLGNSLTIWSSVTVFSFPVAVAIALLLARTNIPFSRGLEFMFWLAFIFPSIASTLGWIMLLAPDWGFLNFGLQQFGVERPGPFNIYSVPGIVWAKLMGDGIAFKVMLLTPAFRNMDGALEEAARVAGQSSLKTLLRVTVPVMISPIVLVLALQLIKMFQGFEVEFMIGTRFNYFVYSTLIYQLIRREEVPQFGPAIVLASVTLIIIAFVIPFQQWIVRRRIYTTVDSGFRPSLLGLGRWRWPAFGAIASLLFLLTALPLFILLVGSVMTRVGFFNAVPLWTWEHWQDVFVEKRFQDALKTTLTLAITAGILSPILFSLLAYVIVRTRQRGRDILDSIIWASAAMPGILLGFGLLLMFLMTPGLRLLFGTTWVLLIVVTISGVTTGTNVFKGVLVQLGASLEEAGRVAGAGWLQTYFRIVIPVLMPTMVLVGMINFVAAAGATSSVVLLASRDTSTLSLLALEFGASGGLLEEASIISVIITILTVGVALPMRALALRLGVRHDVAVEKTR
jgi:iron(III) transport system permease protein